MVSFIGTNRQLDSFLRFINNIHPKSTFTMELESDQHINFLDLSIKRVNNIHEFSIYRKPTHTDITIHNSSTHPYRYKLSAYESMIHRLTVVPMSVEHFSTELRIIKYIALNNGYNPIIFDNISEHQRSYINNKFDSTYSNHITQENHNFNENFEILHINNKGRKLVYLEALEINRYKNSQFLLND